MKLNWRSELPSWLLLGAMFLLAAISWPGAPPRIPVHWNAAGQVDRYGGRAEGLLLLPGISLVLYLLLLLLPRVDPRRANYERFAGAYAVIRTAMIAFLAAVYATIHLALRGYQIEMSLVIAMTIGGLFIVLGGAMGHLRPNWFVGFRTPWTLSSELAWSKTHRLGGWLFIASGLAVLTIGAIRPRWGLGAVLVSAIALAAWALVYSYLVWRHDPNKVPPAGT